MKMEFPKNENPMFWAWLKGCSINWFTILKTFAIGWKVVFQNVEGRRGEEEEERYTRGIFHGTIHYTDQRHKFNFEFKLAQNIIVYLHSFDMVVQQKSWTQIVKVRCWKHWWQSDPIWKHYKWFTSNDKTLKDFILPEFEIFDRLVA